MQSGPRRSRQKRRRRLRPQGRALERNAVEQQLVDRVVGQPHGVVAVGVATGQPEDALPQQIPERIATLSGWRRSRIAPAKRHVRPSRSSTRFNSTSPPSELAWGWSNRATIGLDSRGPAACSALYRLWPSSLLGVVCEDVSTPLFSHTSMTRRLLLFILHT